MSRSISMVLRAAKELCGLVLVGHVVAELTRIRLFCWPFERHTAQVRLFPEDSGCFRSRTESRAESPA